MRVRYQGKEYNLMPGWNEVRFNVLKKEAKDFAKVVIVDTDGTRYLVPIRDLEWIGDEQWKTT